MKKSLKIVSIITSLVLLMSIAAGCGNAGKGGQDTKDVQISVEGQNTTLKYTLYSNDFITIGYDADSLAPDIDMDSDDSPLSIEFDSIGEMDIEIKVFARTEGDYSVFASVDQQEEMADEDSTNVSELTDVTVNGLNAKYYSYTDENTAHERYYIEYTGSMYPSVKYTVLEASYPIEAAEGWVSRVKAMADTIEYK